MPFIVRSSNTLQHLCVESDVRFGPRARPINVTFRDPILSHSWRQRTGMTEWALLRPFDEFERDWNYDACVVVSAMPDLADGAARTA